MLYRVYIYIYRKSPCRSINDHGLWLQCGYNVDQMWI